MDIKPTTPADELPCTCTSMDQYVDGLCPGCIEAADRSADLNDECIYPQPTGNWNSETLRKDRDEAWLAIERELAADAAAIFGEPIDPNTLQDIESEEVREEREDRYYSGTGEMIGDGPDDDSYTRYLNRG